MTSGLRERNRQAAIAEVQRVAVAMMTERGFAAVTVEQVARESNVSPSTVYRYFGTKEAMVISGQRPQKLVERVASDSSDRSSFDAFERAANKVFGRDDAQAELSLVVANDGLSSAFEHQLLDQRAALATVFADRRGAKAPGVRDEAAASAALAVLVAMLMRSEREGKSLDKLLAKSFNALRNS